MLVICFWFLLCFGCSFVIVGDTYVVYWFGGCCLFVGSLVRRLLVVFVWLKFTILGPWGCSWACSCFLAGLVLVVFFCLLRLCRVGVLRRHLELFFIIIIIIIYYFLGALRCSDPAPTSGHAVVLFVVSGEVEICSAVKFC
jgi:hypothetical protein